MTIIAYTKNTLVADRMFINDENNFVSYGKKLFVNPSKTIAFAVSGSEILEEDAKIVFGAVLKDVGFRELLADKTVTKEFTLSDRLKMSIDTNTRKYIFMSKKAIFKVDDSGLYDIGYNNIYTSGTGSTSFQAAIHVGKSIKEAMEITSRMGLFCSPEYDSITQRELKLLKVV